MLPVQKEHLVYDSIMPDDEIQMSFFLRHKNVGDEGGKAGECTGVRFIVCMGLFTHTEGEQNHSMVCFLQ